MKEEVPTSLVDLHVKRVDDCVKLGISEPNHLLEASGIAGTMLEAEKPDGEKTDGGEEGGEKKEKEKDEVRRMYGLKGMDGWGKGDGWVGKGEWMGREMFS